MKEKVDIIILNGLIVTIDKKGTIFKNGGIAISKDKIIYIGENKDVEEKYDADKIINAKNKIVMPGFINAHTHLAMTIFRGIADDIKLSDWLNKYIFPAEQKFATPEIVTLGSELAMLELIHGGTTCFNDMYYYQEKTAEVAKKIGVRGIINEGIIDFPVSNSKNSNEGIDYSRNLLEKYKNDELISVGVAAHSPYTCSSDLIQKTKQLADEYNTIYHIHVAETKWEFDTITEKYNTTPVQYLENLGVLSESTVAAHCVWLTEKDIEILHKRNVGVAHNPECNMKISSGVAPIPKLLDSKIKVGLGTDGAASNNNLNLIQEMHTMALLHKLNTMNPTVLDAETVVRIATIGSAEVLGKADIIGSLEVGKKADIICIDKTFANVIPLYNVYSAIVYSLLGNEVSDVIINGKIIMKDNIILTTNENDIKLQVEETAKKLEQFLIK